MRCPRFGDHLASKRSSILCWMQKSAHWLLACSILSSVPTARPSSFQGRAGSAQHNPQRQRDGGIEGKCVLPWLLAMWWSMECPRFWVCVSLSPISPFGSGCLCIVYYSHHIAPCFIAPSPNLVSFVLFVCFVTLLQTNLPSSIRCYFCYRLRRPFPFVLSLHFPWTLSPRFIPIQPIPVFVHERQQVSKK